MRVQFIIVHVCERDESEDKQKRKKALGEEESNEKPKKRREKLTFPLLSNVVDI